MGNVLIVLSVFVPVSAIRFQTGVTTVEPVLPKFDSNIRYTCIFEPKAGDCEKHLQELKELSGLPNFPKFSRADYSSLYEWSDNLLKLPPFAVDEIFKSTNIKATNVPEMLLRALDAADKYGYPLVHRLYLLPRDSSGRVLLEEVKAELEFFSGFQRVAYQLGGVSIDLVAMPRLPKLIYSMLPKGSSADRFASALREACQLKDGDVCQSLEDRKTLFNKQVAQVSKDFNGEEIEAYIIKTQTTLRTCDDLLSYYLDSSPEELKALILKYVFVGKLIEKGTPDSMGKARLLCQGSIPKVLPITSWQVPEIDLQSFFFCAMAGIRCELFNSRVELAKRLVSDNDQPTFEERIATIRQTVISTVYADVLAAQDELDMLRKWLQLNPAGVSQSVDISPSMAVFMASADLQWPLAHRILKTLQAGETAVGEIVKAEVQLFKDQTGFLTEVARMCECINQPVICQSRYEKFLEADYDKLVATAATSRFSIDDPNQCITSPVRFTQAIEFFRSQAGTLAAGSTGIETHRSQVNLKKLPVIKPAWEDPDFRHMTLYTETGYPQISWLHLPDVILQKHETVTLFGDISPHQVRQGMIGDCWLIAAISSVAQLPSRIKEIFITDKELDRGEKYELRLFVGGREERVTVTDLVPCYHDGNEWKPMYAYSDDNSMWGPLLEKAIAKLKGGYYRIDGGCANTAFQMFNNRPVLSWWKNIGDLWEDNASHVELGSADFVHALKTYTSLGYPVGVSCSEILRSRELTYCRTATKIITGIIAGHVYSVLRVDDIAEDGKIVTWVEVRNPWGRDKGEVCSQKSALCPLNNDQLDFDPNENDGIWRIEMSDFLQAFQKVGVSCRINGESCPTYPIVANDGHTPS